MPRTAQETAQAIGEYESTWGRLPYYLDLSLAAPAIYERLGLMAIDYDDALGMVLDDTATESLYDSNGVKDAFVTVTPHGDNVESIATTSHTGGKHDMG